MDVCAYESVRHVDAEKYAAQEFMCRTNAKHANKAIARNNVRQFHTTWVVTVSNNSNNNNDNNNNNNK